MKKHLQYGFTLVELLVVIAIIGMLSSALIVYVPGALEAGHALKCKTNLKSLAQAFLSCTITSNNEAVMPTAGSFEWNYVDQLQAKVFFFSPGAWVCWTPSGQWPYLSEKSEYGSMTASTFFDRNWSDNNSKAFYSITNGVLWSALGKDANVYVCDTHKKVLERQTGGRVRRSYVMNRYFGYDDRNNGSPYRRWLHVDSVAQSGTAAIRLMFAELPGQLGTTIDTSPTRADSVLDPTNNEYLGFNHKIGKKWIAHVAFADGHIEGLVQPIGANTADLKDLTEHVCDGEEIDATIRAKMQ